MPFELECRDRLLDGIRSLRADWAEKLGTATPWRYSDLSQILRYRTDARCRDRDWSGRPAQHLRARTQSVFLTFAAALAYRRGINHIIGGMCETDYSGYPDCRDETIRALQVALNLGMSQAVRIAHAVDVAGQSRTWKLADELGGAGLVDLVREHSHTCYPRRARRAPRLGLWVRRIPACALRAKGWREYAAGAA